jgi:hypothetical protein
MLKLFRPSFNIRQSLDQLACYSTRASNLIYPDPPTSKHHDLYTFLDYAKRISLDTDSTVYNGTHYEYTVLESLKRLGISTQRIGGQSDHGTDLVGTWKIPRTKKPLKVIVQCKALAKRTGPSLIRELEGSFVGAPLGWREAGVVGLLIAQKQATKGTRDALGRSRWPMGFVMCSADGKITQMLWNQRAVDAGLDGLGIGLKHSSQNPAEKEVVLLWKGKTVDNDLNKPQKNSEKPEEEEEVN